MKGGGKMSKADKMLDKLGFYIGVAVEFIGLKILKCAEKINYLLKKLVGGIYE